MTTAAYIPAFPSVVAKAPAAPSQAAAAHFEAKLAFETDCADVWYATNHETKDFVLVDVRTPALYAAGHVPGAVNIPTRQLSEARLADYPADTLFVVYCAGPHCNGSTKAALKLARMGRPVKEMIGGLTGWIDEGLGLART
ncbi:MULTISPECIES: rhodanese-like domain-containing protein [Nitrospirillum]|uniref:Rhodanese-related sulfurtransferase n=1 Tax=Nitrospirillum amazonense TaxID=28077 RepID=A0A560F034_9PROT|nr:rhodanese-like domain-containing protein [Nitrospirillum amazonense]MEC4594072.1 rhodanese-like domain-containing protein [Nitrospirillum amazonense]TWB14982.1 rhodanese-related sulfurtransferase [Nitrospirillum amazonense]